jgi:hypothetical protein
MRVAFFCEPNDLRFEERETPTIVQQNDAILRSSDTCLRSDL